MAARVLYVAEPSRAWVDRPPVVVDCSVLSAFLWAEPTAAAVQARLVARSLFAPSLLRYELANVARNKVRAGVPESVARAGLDAFAEQRVQLRDIRIDRLFDIAQRLSLTAYDAAYLCLAEELQAPLITLDRRLAEAAKRHLGPPSVKP